MEGITAIWARNRRSKEDVRDASTECEAIRAILRDPRRREPFVRGDVHVGASRSSTCEAMIEARAGCLGRQMPARGGSCYQLGRLGARTPVGAESVDANGARRGFPTSMAPHNKTLELTAKGPTGTVSQVALP